MQKHNFLKPYSIISPDISIENRRYYMELGKRIKKLRKDMKLTQDEFANKLRIHSKQLAKYEAGRTIPSINVIARMANFCEVSADYIIFGEDKALSKKTKIADMELLDYFRRVNKLKKIDRDRIKWAIKSLLNGETE
jgi:transcriptional regulator with XRE-family HTH domain